MDNIKLKKAVQLTHECIMRFCRSDGDFILNLCSPDVLAVGLIPDGFSRGIEMVSRDLDRTLSAICPCSLVMPDIIVAENNANGCTIAARYTTVRYSDAGCPRVQNFCTFVWRLEHRNFVIKHIHISRPCFARTIGKTGALMRSERKNAFDGERKIPVKSENGSVVFLAQSDIIYAAAENKHTMIVTNSGNIMAKISITDFEKATGNCFVFVHRSFVVNIIHISEIRRYCVIMSDKSTIPVPVKKFRETAGLLSKMMNEIT